MHIQEQINGIKPELKDKNTATKKLISEEDEPNKEAEILVDTEYD